MPDNYCGRHLASLYLLLRFLDIIFAMFIEAGKNGPNFIRDIDNYCRVDSKYRGILGVDRTFQLSRCFVTLLTYRHPMLKWKAAEGHPTMFGGVFIHWRGNYEAYYEFFSTIRRKLDCEVPALVVPTQNFGIGSDRERAIMKAAKRIFPEASLVNCTRHLNGDLKRYLIDLGIKKKHRQKLRRDIMGLRESESLDEFDTNRELLGSVIRSRFPRLGDYYDKFSEDLREYVVKPAIKGIIDRDYMTNRNESLNHILRMKTGWRSQDLMSLVRILEGLELAQRTQIRRALSSPGEFELTGPMAKLRVSAARWEQMDFEEKQALEAQFHAGPKVKRIKPQAQGSIRGREAHSRGRPKIKKSKSDPSFERVTSNLNSEFSIPKQKKTALKPNQKRRVRSERTQSHSRSRSGNRKGSY